MRLEEFKKLVKITIMFLIILWMVGLGTIIIRELL